VIGPAIRQIANSPIRQLAGKPFPYDIRMPRDRLFHTAHEVTALSRPRESLAGERIYNGRPRPSGNQEAHDE
jgi:hypothetical protein